MKAIRTLFLLLAIAASSAWGQTVTRGPYLQNLTDSSVIVRWRTDTATDSIVQFGTDSANLSSSANVGGPRTEHSVTLTGLGDHTQYFYSIGDSGGTLAGDASYHFSTAPLPGTAVPTRFWVIGDSGTADAKARAVRDAFKAYTASQPADFLLMLGDNAFKDGTDAQYQAAMFDTYPALLRRMPAWSTLGNHDGATADSATQTGPYYDIFDLPSAGEAGGLPSGTEAYYSYDYGNIHFIVLDSHQTDRSANGTMMTWLESDLAGNDKPWVIAFWHHPPYTKGSHNSDTEATLIDMRQNALPILEAWGVDLVLTAHSASWERSMLIDGHYGVSSTLDAPTMILDAGDGHETGDGAYVKPQIIAAGNQGTVYTVTGTAGYTGGGSLNHPVMNTSMAILGSMVVDVDGDRLDAVFIDSTGTVGDEFTIIKAIDTEPPLITSANTEDETHVLVGFNESLDSASAETFSNYTIDGLSVSGAELLASGKTVRLTTSVMAPGAHYLLTVNNVMDQSSNPIAPGSQAGFDFTTEVIVSFQDGVAPNASYAGTFDATLASDTPDSPLGAGASLTVDGSPVKHSVIGWDINAIPATAIIESAQIHLTVFNTTKNSFGCNAMKRGWVEAETTWNSASAGVPWQTAGATGADDRFSEALCSFGAGSSGPLTITLNAAGIAQIQRWVDGTDPNYGFMLGNPSGIDSVQVNSSEYSQATERPRLQVSYTVVAVPDAPTGLGAVTFGDNQIDLAWSDNSLNETGFGIERSPNGTSGWSFIGTVGADTVSFNDTALSSGNTYYYRVYALNDGGSSAYSNVASATTTGAPSNQAPTATFTYVCTYLDCSFTDTSTDTDGTVSSWSWSYGDGNSSTARNPGHNYASAGTYTVSLTVTDDDGAGASSTQSVTVTAAPLPQVIRGPYLQTLTDSSVIVRWRTDLATDSAVRFGTDSASLPFTESVAGSRTEHTVTLVGLGSHTQYFYSIGDSTGTFAGDTSYHFRTAPLPGTAFPTRFWVIGDSGTADANARAVRDAYKAYTGSAPADFMLMLGDNAYNDGTDAQYQAAVFDTYPVLLRQLPVWPTLGNHDGYTADSATQSGPYYDIFDLPTAGEAGGLASGTEAYYSYDYGNIHFIVLESYETDRSAGGTMMTWLESDLAGNDKPWVIAFWHHPPYTKGSHDSDSEGELIDMRQNALPILEAWGVDLVLSGHSHSYERSMLIDGHYGVSTTLDVPTMVLNAGDGSIAGTGAYEKPQIVAAQNEGAVFAVAGSSGKISGGSLNHPVMYASMNVLGSMILDVDGNQLDAVFLDDTGSVRDEFTILKTVDTDAPLLLDVSPEDATHVLIDFNEPMDVTTAETSTNYTIEGLSVTAAELLADNRTVRLTTSTMTASAHYVLTINNVMDNNGNPIAADSQADFYFILPTTVTFQSGAFDASFRQANPDTNFGTEAFLEVDGGASDKHTLVGWDISTIPAGKVIEAARMHLTVFDTSGGSFNCNAMTRNWVEAEVTWNNASSGVAWATAGGTGAGDRDSTALCSFSAGSTGLLTIDLNADGVAQVQRWVDGTDPNYGFMLGNPSSSDGVDFRSSEYVTVVDRPTFEVTYRDSIPSPVPVPDAPTGLAATAISSSQVDLAWNDNSVNETGFRIERSTDGSIFAEVGTIPADGTSFADTGLAAATSYWYRVSAWNASGDSAYSNVSSATTDADFTITLDLTKLKVKGRHVVDLAWNGTTTADVDIYRDGFWLITVQDTGVYSDQTGNRGGRTYDYQVCEAGTANCSDVVSVSY